MGLKESTPQWKVVSASTTTPIENRTRKDVLIDDYYVVVGFEVNNPHAFDVNLYIHDLGEDYGHAFFYMVKNHIATKMFSFGPNGQGKVGWNNKGAYNAPNKYNTLAFIKDGFVDSRPGTSDYIVSEKVSVFKVPITFTQGKKLEIEIDKERKKIADGKEKYTAFINDTCAETARDVLTDAEIITPSATSLVKNTKIANVILAYAANPYMWHHQFKKSNFKEAAGTLTESDPSQLIGFPDPFFP